MSDESTRPYPLHEALPTDFKAGQYGAPVYPIFSWQWWRRRAWVLVPYAAFIGAALAVIAYERTGDWSFYAAYAARAIFVWVIVILLGTSLATYIRHLQLSGSVERIALPAVVLANVAIGFYGIEWYERFLQAELLVRGIPDLSYPESLRGVVARAGTLLVLVLASGVISLITYFVEQHRWRTYLTGIELKKTREQRDLADSHLTVLQAQVEPHFLYNTMASVRSLIREEPERAEATIDALVEHLRATLPKIREGSASSSKLGDQMDICRSYLDVMRVRMGSRLRYSIDVTSDLAQLSFPPLMLISLVENAIKHGVERKPGACHVTVGVRRLMTSSGEMLEATVADDGAGLSEGPSSGLGLDNIRARLKTLYSERASVKLEARNPGAIATLRVPLERKT